MNEVMAQGLAAIITYLGPTPILLVAVLLGLGPIGMVAWIVNKLNRNQSSVTAEQEARMTTVFERQDKRFEQVVRMYEDNVALVKNYEHHVENQRETNDKLIDLVQISSATQRELVETNRSNSHAIMRMIENNEFCPWTRVKGKRHLAMEEDRTP